MHRVVICRGLKNPNDRPPGVKGVIISSYAPPPVGHFCRVPLSRGSVCLAF